MDTAGEAIVEATAEVETQPTAEETPQLPSDQVEFEVPEKFQGKSVEDVIKSYQELEKLQSKGGDNNKSQEEKPTGEETSEPEAKEAEYQKYAESLDKNGSLSDAEYAELAEQGYDKATVDTEIKRRADLKEFEAYQAEKALNSVLEPLGGGAERFKEVSDWANSTKSEAEMKEFNAALATAPKVAQQAMLRGLYTEFDASVQDTDTILHSGTPQRVASKGYKTQEEFFKDVGSPEYKNNAAYREAVEKKMALSDLF